MQVKIKRLTPEAHIPTYGSEESAGADLYAVTQENGERILPGETKLIHTGIAAELPQGYVGLVFARSGLASRRGLAPANKVGVIDSDYRGEIMVALHNHSSNEANVENGERIAQLVIVPYITANFTEANSLENTKRGTGGFGSTGKK